MTNCENLSDFYRDYGRSLAARLIGLNSFNEEKSYVFLETLGDPKEIVDAAKRSLYSNGDPFLVLEDFQEELDTAGRDNFYSKITGSLAVIIQSGTDKESKRKAYQGSRNLVLQAIALMISDSEFGSLDDNNISVDLREFPCEKIGPINVNCFGFGVQFTWHVPLDLTVQQG